MKKEKIVKVLLTNGETVELKGGKRTLTEVQYELAGMKHYIQEYRTTKNEKITDIDIVEIVK